MRTLSASDLLNAWESALTQHPLQRGLTLLAMVWPEMPALDLASLTIGRRDADLLTLRQQLFGAQLNSIAGCPRCGERLELSFQVDEIRAPVLEVPAQFLQLQSDAVQIHFRPPNSADLLAIASTRDPAAARQQLLQRCLIDVERGATDTAEEVGNPMPEALVAQMLAQMAQADPQGDVQLALACPGCQHKWQMTFDILSYLWQEINDWAQRTLHEVHLLATAYGWREADILALSAQRRHFYLALIGK